MGMRTGMRVLLVDDHRLMREGVRALLEQRADMEVVGEAADGRTAVTLAEELSPDVVVLDVAMPDMNGVVAAHRIRAQCPRVKIIALSMHSDRRFVEAMLTAGATGYLLKTCDFQEVVDAVETVCAGNAYLCPEVASVVVDGFLRMKSRAGAADDAALTPREREVLQLIAEGTTTKEIAYRLEVSPKTVETHRRRIMAKLDIHTLAGLVKYAMREGLSTIET